MAEKQHKIITELEQEQVTLQQEEPGFLLCVVEGCNAGEVAGVAGANFFFSF